MDGNDISEPVLVEGKTCWRKRKARRVSFLDDAAAYFSAFARAVENARNTIYIASWDIDSRIPLLRGDPLQMESTRLGAFLNRVAAAKAGLRVYILSWDFSMIFLLERELFPIFKLDWQTHKRIIFRLDGNHPVGASHHQKMVVIDDSIAFVGGLDLSRSRWDTPEHMLEDQRRIDPDGSSYPPFHDVQVLVDGEAAHSLGDLFRARWATATGQCLSDQPEQVDYPWPADDPSDLTDVEVAIARTEPAYGDRPEVREVEALYCEAIASAKKYIYIENQYFTSAIVADALVKRLQEPDGPEIVMVAPHKSSGWLEEKTMDSLRARLIKCLRENDRFGRFGIYYPVVPGMENGGTFIHSKIIVVDDTLVRVGSSNLTNRSMGLDTECDVAIEANGEPRIGRGISWFRSTLLAEHLGVAPESVEERLHRSKSLLTTVEQLRNSERTLRPLAAEAPEWLESLAPTLSVVDPEKPITSHWMIERFIPEELNQPRKSISLTALAAILVIATLTVAWRWGPLPEWINIETLASWGDGLQDSSVAPFAVPAAYTVGSLLMVPVTLMIGATAVVFDPLFSMIYSFLGCLTSAVIIYGLGRKIGRETLRKIAGVWLNNVSIRLSRQGLLTIIALRLVPVAPFPVVCLIMGASGVRLKNYALGTLIGMAPGIVGISVFAGSLIEVLRNPDFTRIVICIGVAAAVAVLFFGVRRVLARRPSQKSGRLNQECGKACM